MGVIYIKYIKINIGDVVFRKEVVCRLFSLKDKYCGFINFC